MGKKAIKTIFRAATKGSEYTIISNGLLQDKELSSRTRGLVCLLLSHPITWEIEVKNLVKEYKEGRDAVYKMINEAIEHGYMGRFVIKDNRGHIEKHVYWVSDDPLFVPEISLEKTEKIAHLTGEKRRKQRANAQLPENQEVGVKTPLPNLPEVRTNIPTSWNPTSGISGSNTLYKKINIKAAAASYKFSLLAVEEFNRLQPSCGFRKNLHVTTDRLEALAGCIILLSGEDETLETGFAKWSDLLERASLSPWYRGEVKPREGYSRPYALSLDDMADLKILEKLMELSLRLVPGDPRWNCWFNWAKQNDPKLYRIMNSICEGNSRASGWSFAEPYPPNEPGNDSKIAGVA